MVKALRLASGPPRPASAEIVRPAGCAGSTSAGVGSARTARTARAGGDATIDRRWEWETSLRGRTVVNPNLNCTAHGVIFDRPAQGAVATEEHPCFEGRAGKGARWNLDADPQAPRWLLTKRGKGECADALLPDASAQVPAPPFGVDAPTTPRQGPTEAWAPPAVEKTHFAGAPSADSKPPGAMPRLARTPSMKAAAAKDARPAEANFLDDALFHRGRPRAPVSVGGEVVMSYMQTHAQTPFSGGPPQAPRPGAPAERPKADGAHGMPSAGRFYRARAGCDERAPFNVGEPPHRGAVLSNRACGDAQERALVEQGSSAPLAMYGTPRGNGQDGGYTDGGSLRERHASYAGAAGVRSDSRRSQRHPQRPSERRALAEGSAAASLTGGAAAVAGAGGSPRDFCVPGADEDDASAASAAATDVVAGGASARQRNRAACAQPWSHTAPSSVPDLISSNAYPDAPPIRKWSDQMFETRVRMERIRAKVERYHKREVLARTPRGAAARGAGGKVGWR